MGTSPLRGCQASCPQPPRSLLRVEGPTGRSSHGSWRQAARPQGLMALCRGGGDTRRDCARLAGPAVLPVMLLNSGAGWVGTCWWPPSGAGQSLCSRCLSRCPAEVRTRLGRGILLSGCRRPPADPDELLQLLCSPLGCPQGALRALRADVLRLGPQGLCWPLPALAWGSWRPPSPTSQHHPQPASLCRRSCHPNLQGSWELGGSSCEWAQPRFQCGAAVSAVLASISLMLGKGQSLGFPIWNPGFVTGFNSSRVHPREGPAHGRGPHPGG